MAGDPQLEVSLVSALREALESAHRLGDICERLEEQYGVEPVEPKLELVPKGGDDDGQA